MSNTIFVVRHGQTDWNLKKMIQGSTDTTLNDMGRVQACATAKELSEIRFDVVYSSPLSRASETCEIILKDNRYGGVPIFDDRICERNNGILEGESAEKGMKRYPAGWWNIYKESSVEGMETISDIFKRVHIFLDEVKVKYKNQNILIVCHGGVMRAIYFYFNAMPTDGDLYIAYRAGNASVYKYNL